MLLEASYSTKTGGYRIGRDIEYHEQNKNPLLRVLGIGKKKRTKPEFEPISLTIAQETLNRLLSEDGFLMLEIADGRSSVDFSDFGDGNQFFIEQYFDTIYGGIFNLSSATRIVETIFRGCSSEELRDLLPQLPGELVYKHQEKNT